MSVSKYYFLILFLITSVSFADGNQIETDNSVTETQITSSSEDSSEAGKKEVGAKADMLPEASEPPKIKAIQ